MSNIKLPSVLNKYLPDYEHKMNLSILFIMVGVCLILGGINGRGNTTINLSLMLGTLLVFLPFLIFFFENQEYLPSEAIIDLSKLSWSEPAKSKLKEIVDIKGEKLKLKDLREILAVEEKYQSKIAAFEEQKKVQDALSDIMK